MKSNDYEFKSLYKKDVIKKIKDFRKKGATFQEIAKHLNENEYETFSGNGVWYAQSIHRLCK